MNGVVTYFIYDGARPIIEYSVVANTTHMTANTVYGLGIDEIISRNNNGQDQFLLQDRTGSTVAVTGIKGQLLEQYRYDAFGTPTILDENGIGTPDNETQINNRFLFTGREWVSRFGFYEYRARAYHPALGRFMSEDPIGFAAGDTNLFRYCGNDPVNRSDPTGLNEVYIPSNPPDPFADWARENLVNIIFNHFFPSPTPPISNALRDGARAPGGVGMPDPPSPSYFEDSEGGVKYNENGTPMPYLYVGATSTDGPSQSYVSAMVTLFPGLDNPAARRALKKWGKAERCDRTCAVRRPRG